MPKYANYYYSIIYHTILIHFYHYNIFNFYCWFSIFYIFFFLFLFLFNISKIFYYILFFAMATTIYAAFGAFSLLFALLFSNIYAFLLSMIICNASVYHWDYFLMRAFKTYSRADVSDIPILFFTFSRHSDYLPNSLELCGKTRPLSLWVSYTLCSELLTTWTLSSEIVLQFLISLLSLCLLK